MFKVCIVGRPNVGKSSLFNRLIKYKKALVSAKPNLTRDRNQGVCEWDNKSFYVIDTGGVEKQENSFEKNWIVKNVVLGIDEADMILMVVDGKEGINPLEKEMLKWLKTKTKNQKIVLLINKVDSNSQNFVENDFYSLGIQKILKISALHNLGITDLLNEIVFNIPADSPLETINPSDIKISIVGKPNVGKSSLLNKILGEDRVLVSEIPGTTRDSIDTFIEKNGKRYMLIDTAGIKKSNKKDEFETISVSATEEAIKRSNISLLLMDAVTGVTHQDLKIASLITENRKACILVVNKWDLVEHREEYVKKFLNDRKDLFPFLMYAPVIFISAKEGLRVTKIFSLINAVYEQFIKRVPDNEISQLFRDCYSKKYPPKNKKSQPVVVLGGKQLEIAPPLFYVKTSKNGGLNMYYARYLENNIRRLYSFEGVPIHIVWREAALENTD